MIFGEKNLNFCYNVKINKCINLKYLILTRNDLAYLIKLVQLVHPL